MKITLAIPSNRGLIPKTMQCLLELVDHGGYEWDIFVASEGYTIAENRNYIASQACQHNSDYVLMIDDDMTFPPDTLDVLIANNKDICGVIYQSKTEKKGFKMHESLEEEQDETKLFEVKAIGTGIMLIKCAVFYKIPPPWFEFLYYESGQCKQGEDWNFCYKAKNNGYKIYCEPRLKIGHIGSKIV